MTKRKEVSKICFNTSKDIEKKIVKLAEKEISATKSSVINSILTEYFKKRREV